MREPADDEHVDLAAEYRTLLAEHQELRAEHRRVRAERDALLRRAATHGKDDCTVCGYYDPAAGCQDAAHDTNHQ